MTKRIAIAQLIQESNSFNPQFETRSSFEPFDIALGDRVVADYGNTDELGGFVQSMSQWDEPAEPVGLLRAHGWSGGPLAAEGRRWFADALRHQLEKVGPLDGAMLALHGSLVAEDEDDVEGSLMEIVRSVLGPDKTVVTSLDMHGHMTPRMLACSDVMVGYHEIPHIDRYQTGVRAAEAYRRIEEGANPTCAAVRIPMISHGETMNSFVPPLKEVFDWCRRMEAEVGVLGASLFMTQGWLDLPHLGWTMLIYTDDDAEKARHLAEELADRCWSLRNPLLGTFQKPHEAIDSALACDGMPVVFADGADATNSGACGDSVHLLKAFIERSIPGGALTFMVDPEAVAHAQSVGVGGAFSLAVGGKRDTTFSTPLSVRGRVETIKPVQFILEGHLSDHMLIDMGVGAVVRVRDVTIVFTESTGPGSTPLLYQNLGLEPRDFKIVVAKSPSGFRVEYEPFAADIILLDTPGPASPNFAQLPFTRINRPLWPIDDIGDDVDWRDIEWPKTTLEKGIGDK